MTGFFGIGATICTIERFTDSSRRDFLMVERVESGPGKGYNKYDVNASSTKDKGVD